MQRAPGHLPPDEALAAAEPNTTVRPDDWLVLTVDVGDVLETVDESTVLAASENGTDHVTLSLVQTNPPPSLQAHEIPVADLARRVDAENGTITYLYDGQSPTLRGTDPVYRVTLTVGAANAHVSRSYTVGTDVRVHSPRLQIGGRRLNDDPRTRDILPNRSNVTVPLTSSFAASKPLDVSVVRFDGTAIVPPRTVTMNETGTARLTVDLSAVQNGTAASVVVTDGHTGRTVDRNRVVIGEIPDPEIADISQGQLLPVNGNGTVTVAVNNEGTAAFDGPVTVTFDGTTHTKNLLIPPAGRVNVTFSLQTGSAGPADFTAAVGSNEDYQRLRVGGPTVEYVEVGNSTAGEVVVSPQRERPLELTAALANPSVWEATTTVTATVGDETVRKQVTVPSGETSQVTLSVPVAALPDGTYDLTVQTGNDTVTRTLAVTPETPTQTPTATSTDRTPGADGSGFGIVVTVLALVSAARYRMA